MTLRPAATRLALAAVLASTLAGAAVSAATPRLRADRPVRVTGPSPFPESCKPDYTQHHSSETEPAAAVSPRDPDVMVASWMQDANVAHPIARTTDGGRTWRTVVVPGLTECTGADRTEGVFDPWVSYGGDGTLYLSSAAGAQPHPLTAQTGTYSFLSRNVWVHVSRDDGRSWSEPVVAGGDDHTGFIVDRPTISGDPRRPGTAYVVWARISGAGTSSIGFSRTADGGRTWVRRVLPLYVPGSKGLLFASQVVVEPRTGDLVLLAAEATPQAVGIVTGSFQGPTRFFAMRSTNQGDTWSPPVQFGEAPQFPELPIPAMAPDGTLHAAWSSSAEDDGSSVVVATSRDAGRTWGAPVTVADASRRAHVPTPVTDARGHLALTWYEDRGALVGAVSRDRGRTWTIRDLATRLDADSAPATNAAGGARYGDYTGLVAGRRGFVSIASLPAPYAKHGPTDLFATRFGQ